MRKEINSNQILKGFLKLFNLLKCLIFKDLCRQDILLPIKKSMINMGLPSLHQNHNKICSKIWIQINFQAKTNRM